MKFPPLPQACYNRDGMVRRSLGRNAGRKVRTPQGTVVANGHPSGASSVGRGRVPQRMNRRWPWFGEQSRSDGSGKGEKVR